MVGIPALVEERVTVEEEVIVVVVVEAEVRGKGVVLSLVSAA